MYTPNRTMLNTVLKGLLFLVPTTGSFFLNGLYSPERGPTGLNCSGLLACFTLSNKHFMSKTSYHYCLIKLYR